jgi:hypothetical protein
MSVKSLSFRTFVSKDTSMFRIYTKKTRQRKLPLFIHIDPKQPLLLNKTCRYCPPGLRELDRESWTAIQSQMNDAMARLGSHSFAD